MSGEASRTRILLAWIAVALLIVFAALGLLWHGFSAEVRARIWENLLERPSGPMWFRFILQPVMAALAALHDGAEDARLGRSPYLWTLLTDASARIGRLREGVIANARVLLLGLVMDTIYQFLEFKAFYPGEAVVVTLLLAFLPYLLLRGPCERIARWRLRGMGAIDSRRPCPRFLIMLCFGQFERAGGTISRPA